MKNKVLEFLAGDGTPEDRYNTAMELYRKSEGNSPAAVNYYNRAGYTVHNLANICYDLKKLYEITDAEIADVTFKAKMVELSKEKERALMKARTETLNQLADFDIASANYNELKKMAAVLKLDLPDMKKQTIFDALIAEKTENIKGTISPFEESKTSNTSGKVLSSVSEAPEAAKAGFKIREEFPFLSSPDCPDKLKILVADMFTAWDNYKAAHAELLKLSEEGQEPRQMTDDEIFALAKDAVENFELNRSIWEELDYYEQHKEILGNHPIFADEVLKEKVAKFTDAAALKRRNNLRTYISRDTPKIANAATEAAGQKIAEKVKEWTQEMNLLNARLGE